MADKQLRADIYMADRNKGMTYKEIAKKHGVSHQAVAQVCAKRSPGHFKPYTQEEVVYPNLRMWLNENKVSRTEFIRRIGWETNASASAQVSGWFRGCRFPTKKIIDRFLAVTGLTYEELFWEGDENA